MLWSFIVAGLPISRHPCVPLGALLLWLAGCEGRPLPPGDDGIEFGDGTDGGDGGDEPGDGDGDEPGDGDGDPAIECAPIVDSFEIDADTPPEAFACLEQVLGDLTIKSASLASLAPLASLREVGGTLHIVGALSLTSLTGLDELERSGHLFIERNRNLSDLHGLAGLTAVEQITIRNNDGMTSLAGLPAGLAPSALEIDRNKLLASLDGLPKFAARSDGALLSVRVSENPALIDLGGLSDCCADQAIDLSIDGNSALPDLGGLESFARLDALALRDNPALASLAGLDSLVEVQTLEIAYNRCLADNAPTLVDLVGAPQLGAVDVLRIEWVASLESLAGLAGLSSLTTLQIRYNDALPWDAVLDLAGQTGPLLLDACGGLGGPECPPADACPMF